MTPEVLVSLSPALLVVVLVALAALGSVTFLPAMVCSGLMAAAGSAGTVVAAEAVRSRYRRR